MFKKVHKSRHLYRLGKKSRQIVRFSLTADGVFRQFSSNKAY